MEIKDFPAKTTRGDTDKLLIQESGGSYRHIQSSNFLAGIASSGGGSKLAVVVDRKPAGTAGGDSVSGGWRKRTLNTILVDAIGLSLPTSNDGVNLPAKDSGVYLLRWRMPTYAPQWWSSRAFDWSNNQVLSYGDSHYAWPSVDAFVWGEGIAVFSATQARTISIDIYVYASRATFGLGGAVSPYVPVAYEQYTSVQVEWIA